MNQFVLIIAVTWLAGMTAFFGGIIAMIEGSAESETKREIIHGVIAFGGGILVAAIAFALTPAGIARLGTLTLTAVFCSGGVLFCLLDVYLSRQAGSRAQFMAMLMDFVPESISLGATFVHDKRLGFLLAAFIGAQNLPEGFNSFREMLKTGNKPYSILYTFLAISLLGPVAASVGYLLLNDHPGITAGIMNFAAGGILYLIFQDIAPQSKMRRHWAPPLGAVLGFVVGMIGKQLIG